MEEWDNSGRGDKPSRWRLGRAPMKQVEDVVRDERVIIKASIATTKLCSLVVLLERR